MRRGVRRDPEAGDARRRHGVPYSPVQSDRASGEHDIFEDNEEKTITIMTKVPFAMWKHDGLFKDDGSTEDDDRMISTNIDNTGAFHNVEAQEQWRKPTWRLRLLSL